MSSGHRSMQLLGSYSDGEIKLVAEELCQRLGSEKYLVTWLPLSTVIRNIELEDEGIMLILSSDSPVRVEGVHAGKNSVVILGHMSIESVKAVAGVYGVKLDAADGKKVFCTLTRQK